MSQSFIVRFMLYIGMLLLCVHVSAEPSVVVKGLFKDNAILIIDGRQTLLKVGKTSREGVKLIRADSKGALIERDGERTLITLSTGIGTAYAEPESQEVRLTSQYNGHHTGTAKFNGHSLQFLVDTGASYISMNSNDAERIGLRYKRGKTIHLNTAKGITKAFQTTLNSVELGILKTKHIAVVVLEGDSPTEVLLGNSFLSQFDMKIINGVMILQTKGTAE